MENRKKRRLHQSILCMVCVCLILEYTIWQERREEAGQAELAVQYVNASIVQEKPKIALTFDDGPNQTYTPVLLDGLKDKGVKATFFVIGENARKNPEVLQRIAAEGHLIGNHTYHHVEITKLPEEEGYQELAMTNETIQEITGEVVSFMRPPFGCWNRNMEENLTMFPVMWTIDPLDWTTENVDEIVNKVVTQADENDIILLHDCYQTSVDAALRIIDILQKEGFQFVTVEELIMN